MRNYDHYIIFADLFRYPGENYPELIRACQQMIETRYPEFSSKLDRFSTYILSHTQDEREELYTKTFDVQPICYLDLGYVIFGEDYKRGAFLLHMQEEQLKANNDCGTDLSDNISNMLMLYTKTKDNALLEELAVKIMIPGLEKMIAEFKQARVDLKLKVLKKLHRAIIQEELNQGNVYEDLFTTLLAVFNKDFGHVHFDKLLDPAIDIQHHKSFFGKGGAAILTQNKQKNELNNLVNEYNLD